MRCHVLSFSLLATALSLASCTAIRPTVTTGATNLAALPNGEASQALDEAHISAKNTETTSQPSPIEEKDSDGDGVADYLDRCPGTPNNVVVDEHGCPTPVEYTCEGMDDNLHRLSYGTGVSELDSKSFEALDEFMSRYGPIPVSFNVNGFDVKDYDIIYHIESHTSKNEVTDEYALSKARAETLKQILIERYGVDEQAFKLVIHTSDRPIAPNDSAEGRRLNQRIYMRVTAQLKTASK